MNLVTPAIGLIFWTVIIFVLLLIILRVFAWKPILSAVKNRNEKIANALEAAEKAKEEMQQLKNDNEKILKEARAERETIIKEARDLKTQMVSEAKNQAKIEADKIIQQAKQAIENEKHSAVNEIKNQMAKLSVDIAEKLLQKELSNDKQQKELIENLLHKTNIN